MSTARDVFLAEIPTGIRPPLSWFTDPGLTTYTPITLKGHRVFGHIGTWDEPHVGFNGRPVHMPRSRDQYRRFLRGGVRVDDNGTERVVAVGHLTAGTSHADGHLSADATSRHYDHSGYSWAYVAAGEDEIGVWVAGMLSPTATDAQITEALAHPPSGDWRPIQGNLELTAVLHVNVPGFGVDRARVASGQLVSLIASGRLAPQIVADDPPATFGRAVDPAWQAARVADTTVSGALSATASTVSRIEITPDGDIRFIRADDAQHTEGVDLKEQVDILHAAVDEVVASAEHAALLASLDDSADRAAALLAELDDTQERMTALLAALADDDEPSEADLQALADLAADDGIDEEAFVSRMPPQLRRSYLTGKVAARIRWNTPGDMTRCMAQAKVHGMGQKGPGACAQLHKAATGVWPGDRRNR